MKCTDFYKKHRELDAIARQELIAAVEAHGGEYVFLNSDEDAKDWQEKAYYEAPVVMGSYRHAASYSDYYVSRLKVEDGRLAIYGFLSEYEDPSYEDEIETVATGQLQWIIEAIPETEAVRSVEQSKNNAPILILSREDVEEVGFSSDMTDAQFDDLVELMRKRMCMDDFWFGLKFCCEHLCLNPYKSEEDA